MHAPYREKKSNLDLLQSNLQKGVITLIAFRTEIQFIRLMSLHCKTFDCFVSLFLIGFSHYISQPKTAKINNMYLYTYIFYKPKKSIKGDSYNTKIKNTEKTVFLS